MPLSVREQDHRMRAEFPKLKLVADLGFMAVWEGPLTPICQTYTVRITYVARRNLGVVWLDNPGVSIVVLDPLIGPDPRGTGQPPEHTYRWQRPAEYPALCVYDPVTDEWTREKSIADVLMPMIIKWFVFHEDWVVTGVWRGGGRHPEPTNKEDEWQKTNSNPADRVQRARSLNAAFHSYGQKVGHFASYLWMEEEYGGDTQPPSWPISSSAIVGDDGSPSILTSSPAHPLAAFLPSDWVPDSAPANSETSTSTAATKSSRNARARSRAA